MALMDTYDLSPEVCGALCLWQACFLTRGDLYVSWERGAATFDRLLVDDDWAVNNGNWMWLSCSSFFYQYYR